MCVSTHHRVCRGGRWAPPGALPPPDAPGPARSFPSFPRPRPRPAEKKDEPRYRSCSRRVPGSLRPRVRPRDPGRRRFPGAVPVAGGAGRAAGSRPRQGRGEHDPAPGAAPGALRPPGAPARFDFVFREDRSGRGHGSGALWTRRQRRAPARTGRGAAAHGHRPCR